MQPVHCHQVWRHTARARPAEPCDGLKTPAKLPSVQHADSTSLPCFKVVTSDQPAAAHLADPWPPLCPAPHSHQIDLHVEHLYVVNAHDLTTMRFAYPDDSMGTLLKHIAGQGFKKCDKEVRGGPQGLLRCGADLLRCWPVLEADWYNKELRGTARQAGSCLVAA